MHDIRNSPTLINQKNKNNNKTHKTKEKMSRKKNVYLFSVWRRLHVAVKNKIMYYACLHFLLQLQ